MIATLTAPRQFASTPATQVARRPLIGTPPVREEISVTSVATLVLWLSCAGVAAVGASLSYARPSPKRVEPAPVQAETLQVQLSEPTTRWTPPPSRDFAAPPPPSALAEMPAVAAPIAVAAPGSAVAFAVPVSGPVRIVDVADAGYRGEASSAEGQAIGSPAPQTLVFGEGDGRQPAPSYPPRAVRQGQEGVVGVRLTVDAAGRVIAAEAAQPCAWPLLNEAAIRAVRDSWRFRQGAMRVYDVAIRFRLKR